MMILNHSVMLRTSFPYFDNVKALKQKTLLFILFLLFEITFICENSRQLNFLYSTTAKTGAVGKYV